MPLDVIGVVAGRTTGTTAVTFRRTGPAARPVGLRTEATAVILHSSLHGEVDGPGQAAVEARLSQSAPDQVTGPCGERRRARRKHRRVTGIAVVPG